MLAELKRTSFRRSFFVYMAFKFVSIFLTNHPYAFIIVVIVRWSIIVQVLCE